MSGIRTDTALSRRAGHPMRWRVLAVSQLAGFMALLDVSIVNVALPSIERGLNVSAATVQWVVSGYALALGLPIKCGGSPRPTRNGPRSWRLP